MTEAEKTSILLISCSESYWVLEGEEHLNAMLSDEAYYPKPVRMINYQSSYELQMDLPEGIFTGNLWGIHPGIIERLRRLKDIIEEDK